MIYALASAYPGETVAVTIGLPGYGPIGYSENPSISADGRFVAFTSLAPDLVLGDLNGTYDIFVTDRQTGITVCASSGLLGAPGNGESTHASISSDGRFVAFASYADDLVPGDTYAFADIFVRDLTKGITVRVSLPSVGTEADGHSFQPSISADGRFIAFSSDARNVVPGDVNGCGDVFVRDLAAATTSRISLSSAGLAGNQDSSLPSVSADGRFVAFMSGASNLVAGDTNACVDAFLRDRLNGTTKRASVNSAGIQANARTLYLAMSADGLHVAFESDATNLSVADNNGSQDVFVHDVFESITTQANVSTSGIPGNRYAMQPSISADGRFVAFHSNGSNLVPGDTNDKNDIFLRDRFESTISRLSLDSNGIQGNGRSEDATVSGDGRFVAFRSYASNLVSGDKNGTDDIFARDVAKATTARISVEAVAAQGYGHSSLGSISANGRYVAFASEARNLVEDDTNGFSDVFVLDATTGTTRRASVSTAGAQANRNSDDAKISADGRYVAFRTDASNLVTGDTNGQYDVFVRDLIAQTTTRVSLGPGGAQGNNGSTSPSISADGRYVAYLSWASNLVAGDTNGYGDVFVRELVSGSTVRANLSSAGAESNGDAERPTISADGRYVAFSSAARNLVADDTNGHVDVFVRDTAQGITTRMSVSSGGIEGNADSRSASISADGRRVAFTSLASNLVPGDTNGYSDVFVRDTIANTTTTVSVNSTYVQANRLSDGAAISANGRYVGFTSSATNLVPGDSGGWTDVFVRDLDKGTTSRISVDSAGTQGNRDSQGSALSFDGHFVVFGSLASNLTHLAKHGYIGDVFRHELAPPPGPVIAKLLFESWGAALPPTTGSYVLRTATGTVISSGTIEIASDGSIEVPQPSPGEYELLVKSWVFLQKKVVFSQRTWAVDLGTVTLTNGDCDGDNVVGLFDYLLLTETFDSEAGQSNWNPRADLDADGRVGVEDYLILSENFDREGDS